MSDTVTNETRDLIASNKVEGTAVYSATGEKLGSVYNFMVDKRSGKVAYAVPVLRRIPRDGIELSSATLGTAHLRSFAGRLSGESYSGAAHRSTDLLNFRGSGVG